MCLSIDANSIGIFNDCIEHIRGYKIKIELTSLYSSVITMSLTDPVDSSYSPSYNHDGFYNKITKINKAKNQSKISQKLNLLLPPSLSWLVMPCVSNLRGGCHGISLL